MRFKNLAALFFIGIFTLTLVTSSCKGKKDKDSEENSDSIAQVPETVIQDANDNLVITDDHQMKEPTQKRLADLFAIAKSGKFKPGTEYFAYRGKDSTRVLKDSFRSADELEREIASYSLEEVKKWLGKTGKYEFGNFYTLEKGGLSWLVQDVTFQRENKPLKISFWMLDINGQLVIGEMK